MGVLRSNVVLGAGVAAALVLHGPATADAQSGAQAQAPSHTDRQAAKEFVDKGIAAQNAKDYDKAIEFYNKASALIPHPILLFNIGQAHRLAGRPDRAAPFYERYLANDPNGSESTVAREILAAFYYSAALAQLKVGQEVEARDNLERTLRHGEGLLGMEQLTEAQRQLREIKRQLGRIHVTCQTKGAEITLNGVTLFIGPGSYTGWLKAKTYELTAKKTGYQSDARQVAVSAGKIVNIDLNLVTSSQAANSSRRWAAWKPWVPIAIGGTIAAAGSAFQALSARSFNSYDNNFSQLPCALERGCRHPEIPGSLNDQLIHAGRQRAMAVGGYVIGGSLIAAGVVLLYLNRSRLAGRRADSSAQNVAVSPAVFGDILGISISMDR